MQIKDLMYFKKSKKRELITRLKNFVDIVKLACDSSDENHHTKFKKHSFNMVGGCDCIFESSLGDRNLYVSDICILYKENGKTLFLITFDKEINVVSDYLTPKEIYDALSEIHDYILRESARYCIENFGKLQVSLENLESKEPKVQKNITKQFKEYMYEML